MAVGRVFTWPHSISRRTEDWKDCSGREKFSSLPPSTSQKTGRSLVNGMSVQMADGVSVQKKANCPRNGL